MHKVNIVPVFRKIIPWLALLGFVFLLFKAVMPPAYNLARFLADLNAALAPESQAAQRTGQQSESLGFEVAGEQVRVWGESILVYEFPDAAAAEAQAEGVSPSGYKIERKNPSSSNPEERVVSMHEWRAPPHFFKRGRLIVLYAGENQRLLALLAQILGPQFAEGRAIFNSYPEPGQAYPAPGLAPAPLAYPAPAYSLAGFLADLNAALAPESQATQRTGQQSESLGFEVAGDQVRVWGESILVYEFPDAAAAEAQAEGVSPSGYKIERKNPSGSNPEERVVSMHEWRAPPHFFKRGRLIVLYAGENQGLLALLAQILGPQFAGASPAGQVYPPPGLAPNPLAYPAGPN